MRLETGDKTLLSLASGQDDYGNFKIAGAPSNRITDPDLALCREDTKIRRRLLYDGAKRGEKHTRFYAASVSL